MQRKKGLLVCFIMTLILSLGAFATLVYAEDSVTVFDGSTLPAANDLAVDSVEVVNGYSVDGDDALLFSISGSITEGHNLKFDVGENEDGKDYSEYDALSATIYVSDISSFTYFGWQNNWRKMGEAQPEGVSANKEGSFYVFQDLVVAPGWYKIVYPLKAMEYTDRIYRLMFTVNFAKGAEKDMFILIDNIKFEKGEGFVKAAEPLEGPEVPVFANVRNVFDGSSEEGLAETEANVDGLSLTEEYALDGQGVKWDIKAEADNHTLRVPLEGDYGIFSRLDVEMYISDWMSFGYFGLQLVYDKDGAESTENAQKDFQLLHGASGGYAKLSLSLSEHKEKVSKLKALLITVHFAPEGDKRDMFIVLDSIDFVRTGAPADGFSVGGKEYKVTDGSDIGSIFENASGDKDELSINEENYKTGTSAIEWKLSAETRLHNVVIPVEKNFSAFNQLSVTLYVSEWAEFEFLGIQLHYINGQDGGTVEVLPFHILSEAGAGWATVTYDISAFVGKLDLYNLFLTANITEGNQKALSIIIDDVTLAKVEKPITRWKSLDNIVEVGDSLVVYDGSTLDGISSDFAESGDPISITNEYFVTGNSGLMFNISGAIQLGHNIKIPVGKNVSDYNQLDITLYISQWASFSHFGWQFWNGTDGAIPFPLQFTPGIKAGWGTISLDISGVDIRYLDINQLFFTANFETPGDAVDMFLVIDNVTFRKAETPENKFTDLDNTVIYEGEEIGGVTTDLAVDSLEITEEYVRNGLRSLKWNISKDATVGHNIKIPVNENCGRFNSLEIVMYVSDWSEFSYFGWQLHHTAGVEGGLVLHVLEGAGAGWVTATYDITPYKDKLDLLNLFFTVNFAEGKEKDMFIVVDSVALRRVEEPVTAYTVMEDKVAPTIRYIKYFNLENEAEIGDVIDLSGITVSDNEDHNPTLEITVTKDGKDVELSADKKFTVSEHGTYSVKLVARDASGNETEVTLLFTAEKGNGGEQGGCAGCKGTAGAASITALLALAAAAAMKRRTR